MTMQIVFRSHNANLNPVMIIRSWWRVIVPGILSVASTLLIVASYHLSGTWFQPIYAAVAIPLFVICLSLPPLPRATREKHWRGKAHWHGDIVAAANQMLDNRWTYGLRDKLSWRYKRLRYGISYVVLTRLHTRLLARMQRSGQSCLP